MDAWRRVARPLAVVAVVVVVALLLLGAGPRLGLLVALVRHPQHTVDAAGADSAALAMAGAAAWLVLGWLALALGVTAAGHLPGAAGRLAQLVADVAVPATLRRVAALALGLSLATGAGMATAAAATPVSPVTRGPAATLNLDWPSSLASGGRTHTPPPVRHAQPAVVQVTAGDSLWSLAARSLPPGASERQIAAEWPRWYAANRALIGADPSLIRPGQHLHAPTPRRSA